MKPAFPLFASLLVAGAALAQEPEDVTAAGAVVQPAPAPATAPATAVPPPPAARPPPPAQAPAAAPAQVQAQAPAAAVPAGQWVRTAQYGWVWMPYAQQYTSVPAAGDPLMYLYGPSFGWSWVAAPWVFGWGPTPYWGAWGLTRYAWYARPWFRPRWGGWYAGGWYGPRHWGGGWRGGGWGLHAAGHGHGRH